MITANIYEKTYVSVKNAVHDTEYLDKLVSVLRSNREPMTCADLGHRVFGDLYGGEYVDKSLSARMGQMLSHLRQGGFIKVDLIDGAPVEIMSYEYVEPQNVPPRKLRVHDEDGNEYFIDNPKWDFSKHRGHFEDVKKTIVPKVKTYVWVAE